MKEWTLVGVAVVIVAGIGVALAGAGSGDSTPQAPPGPIVAHEPGAELVYEGVREDVTVHVLEPRLVRDAGWDPVEGVPLVLAKGGGEPQPGSPVVVEGVEEGGLLVKGKYCDLSEEVSCASDGFGVSWQHCRLWAAWTAPFNTVTGEQINDPPVTVEDPVSGLTWNYSVTWESSERVRLSLQEGADQSTQCSPDEGAVIDVQTQRVVLIEDGFQRHELVEVRPGSGDPIAMGQGELSVSRFVASNHTREHPYPPGAGSLGHENFTLEQAWETARQNETVQAFVDDHPRAYLEIPSRGASHGSYLGDVYTQDEHRWETKLVAASTDAIWVNVTKTVTHVGPVERTEHDVDTGPAAPPEDAEPGFQPPGERAASLQAFAREAEKRGFQIREDPSPLWYSAHIDPERQHAGFAYFLQLEGQTSSFMSPTLMLEESGRAFQLTAGEETRERVFQVDE